MTNTFKVLIATGTIGTIGGGVFIANSYLQPKIKKNLIKQKLIEEGFDLNIDGAGWKAILISYNKTENFSKTFKSEQAYTETEDGLKGKCEEIWKQENISEENYKKAKQWCVKEESIDKILERGKYKKLSLVKTQNGDDDFWNKKASSLKTNKTAFSSVSELTDNKANNISAMKDACVTLKTTETKTTSEEFINNFELSRDWCFIKNSNN